MHTCARHASQSEISILADNATNNAIRAITLWLDQAHGTMYVIQTDI